MFLIFAFVLKFLNICLGQKKSETEYTFNE